MPSRSPVQTPHMLVTASGSLVNICLGLALSVHLHVLSRKILNSVGALMSTCLNLVETSNQLWLPKIIVNSVISQLDERPLSLNGIP